MTKLSNVLAVCVLAAPVALVAQQSEAPAPAEHSDHEQHAAPSTPPGVPAGPPMAAMHAHMAQMREQMARIGATEDPAERERLMNEHMQSMQQHMQMMSSMGMQHGAGSPGGCAEADAACRMNEMQAESRMMGQRMGAMEDRLESMQQMLQQMLEHQRMEEAQDSGELEPDEEQGR